MVHVKTTRLVLCYASYIRLANTPKFISKDQTTNAISSLVVPASARWHSFQASTFAIFGTIVKISADNSQTANSLFLNEMFGQSQPL
ncbi:MAG: hypothetical protein CMH08_02750 [Marinovum sp.]|nr:hypothetical protein [Marinovum sp.]